MDSAMAHVNAAFCPHTLAGGKGQLLQLSIKLNEVNQSQKPVISSNNDAGQRAFPYFMV
jgi:hypothetical protein